MQKKTTTLKTEKADVPVLTYAQTSIKIDNVGENIVRIKSTPKNNVVYNVKGRRGRQKRTGDVYEGTKPSKR